MRIGIFGVAVAAIAVAGGSLGCGGEAPAPAPISGAKPQVEQQAGAKPPAAQKAGAKPPVGQKAAGQVQPLVPLVQVKTSLSRTAVWVGDPVVWTVELTCAPTVDVIADDLAGDKLGLDGLEFVTSETERGTSPDGGVIHRVHYHLRSYEINKPVLKTVAFSVRYYVLQPGQRAEDLTPAGEARVPGAMIAWRSTIQEGIEEIVLREARPPESVPTVIRVARPLGIALVLLSIVPVALWGISRVRHARRPKKRRTSARAIRAETRRALETLRNADTSSSLALREAYTGLNTTLRRHVAGTTGVPAMALASEEVAERFRKPGSRLPGEAMAEVLAECDRARYGPPEKVPPSDRFRDSVEATERLL